MVRRLIVVLSVAAFYAPPQTAVFDRAPWLQDYAAMKQALEKTYANLAWFGSPEGSVDLPGLDRRTIAALQSAASDDEARAALLNFVRGFHDGHFSQLRAPATGDAPASRPDFAAMSRGDAAAGCAALSYTPDSPAAFSRPFESLPGYRQIADGVSQPFRAAVLSDPATSIRLGLVRIPEFEEQHPSLCPQLWARDEFWSAQGTLLRGPMRRAIEQRWYQTMADLLRTFREDGVTAVLVDVGTNSGGDDSGDIAARLFTAMPIHSAPLWMTQDDGASAGYFDEQLDALSRLAPAMAVDQARLAEARAAFTAGKAKLSEPACAMDWAWRERRAWASQPCRRLVEAGSAGGPVGALAADAVADVPTARALHWPMQIAPLWGTWTGPLYVLTDNRTYSAAEMFAAVLQNNRAAKTVGVLTGGDGCGFMTTPKPLVLPHSQLRFRVPNCVRLRADGTDEVAGVAPDIAVPRTDPPSKIVEAIAADRRR